MSDQNDCTTSFVPRAFDESEYPVQLSAKQAAIVAYMRVVGRAVRHLELCEGLDMTYWQVYRAVRRLRAAGVVYSMLNWQNFPSGNGGYCPRRENGEVKLMSWLDLYLAPLAEWGKAPDAIQDRFDPRRKSNGLKGTRPRREENEVNHEQQ